MIGISSLVILSASGDETLDKLYAGRVARISNVLDDSAEALCQSIVDERYSDGDSFAVWWPLAALMEYGLPEARAIGYTTDGPRFEWKPRDPFMGEKEIAERAIDNETARERPYDVRNAVIRARMAMFLAFFAAFLSILAALFTYFGGHSR